ncbi:unnamed protein product [Sphenostylis stenocarpa]|uniref:Uncharacterized protein n=1 Tax=Sphenostylis stenocarpa TaxID=92480 RepID=A0AA86T116_9FABA|nr:unnamed protein product [Sphenostylis stenocarpa]
MEREWCRARAGVRCCEAAEPLNATVSSSKLHLYRANYSPLPHLAGYVCVKWSKLTVVSRAVRFRTCVEKRRVVMASGPVLRREELSWQADLC